MIKARQTNKALLLLTLFFIFIAALSFAAFQKTDMICSEAKRCYKTLPATHGGEMLWDVFSRRLISLVSLN